MSRSRLLPALAILSTACNRDMVSLADAKDANASLLPSLTDVRIGAADSRDYMGSEPIIPDDEEVAGAIAPDAEDYALQGEDEGTRDPGINTDLSAMWELDDPAALEKHRDTDLYPYKRRMYGSLYDDAEGDIDFTDVVQGSIANCYMAAAFAAVLYADTDHAIREGMIHELNDADGNVLGYSVRVYHAWNGPQDVYVDADLVRKSGDKVLYARSADTAYNDEEWAISLMEKAFAQWRGGYEVIGNGGYSGDVMQGLMGSTATSRSISYMDDDTLINAIHGAVEQHRPVTAGTFGKGEGPFGPDGGADPEGTQIYAWHAYTVLDAAKGTDTSYVKIRNPWGQVEPSETYGEDPAFDTEKGKDDGIFWITTRQFRRLYSSIVIGGTWEADDSAPAEVEDLQVVAMDAEAGTATISFKASGDDEDKGLAWAYDIRIADRELTDSNFADAAAVGQVADPKLPGEIELITIDELDLDKTWYVGVVVLDEVGNASLVQSVRVKLGEDEEPAAASEAWSFEAGLEGWEAEGLWHISDLDAAEGSYSLWMGQDDSANYSTGGRVEATLTSPEIDLSDATSATLSWSQLLDVEADAGYDEALLQVRAGNGSWTTVWSKDGVSDAFAPKQAVLDEYVGQAIQVRFSFDSVDGEYNTGLGWLVDDVKLGAE